jgi:hypothetical protein
VSNDPDRDAALLAEVTHARPEDVAERIQTLEDGLHDFKHIAVAVENALEGAAQHITNALSGLNNNDPETAYNHVAKGFAEIAIARHAAKRANAG